jgi:hypothetical protein
MLSLMTASTDEQKPARIGDLLDQYGKRYQIIGTAYGYTFQRRRTDGRPYGGLTQALDTRDLAAKLRLADETAPR